MKNLEECLENLSPLMDDVIALMGRMGLSSPEHIALGFLVASDFSIRTVLATTKSGGDELTAEQCQTIVELLQKKQRKADEIMSAASEMFAAPVQ